ncbi:uncharacterized protein Nmag_3897 (plasmid) [Natrialba magadii ATCC 43099]|uniref:Uncharacterized protein n=1 Tax=Natrialba magadii (strain ATCC 43099 / DSM 3394 / CCM 3739 / CIP 104546 / IAM 13178 / JCM 8861 / NBRC 102185 / NCIMB 2190 / MS3) TaxID=547559 RepID=D3T1H9_NATMM|nr:hypothetical protein [Natrialba magadii]ADD07438.1 uncharacterized protein Nmag_3897 [Natrialba magadii ATCC 43099]
MSSPALDVTLFRDEDVDNDTLIVASDAIGNLADQLGTDSSATPRGKRDGPDHDDYDGYLSELEDEDVPGVNVDFIPDGNQGLLLYKRDLDSDVTMGASRSRLRSDDTCYAVVNAQLMESIVGSESAFRNAVKHELLHSLMNGDDNCPGTHGPRSDDHSCGHVEDSLFQATITPMATGYALSLPGVGTNPPPSEFCGYEDDPSGDPNWTPDLSECTESEATRWLNEEY